MLLFCLAESAWACVKPEVKPLFIQVSMPMGVDCGFETTFFGKCYPGKRDPLLVPEKRQDILKKKTRSVGLVEPGPVVSDETPFRANEAALALRPVSYLEDLKSQGHYFHDTAPPAES